MTSTEASPTRLKAQNRLLYYRGLFFAKDPLQLELVQLFKLRHRGKFRRRRRSSRHGRLRSCLLGLSCASLSACSAPSRTAGHSYAPGSMLESTSASDITPKA